MVNLNCHNSFAAQATRHQTSALDYPAQPTWGSVHVKSTHLRSSTVFIHRIPTISRQRPSASICPNSVRLVLKQETFRSANLSLAEALQMCDSVTSGARHLQGIVTVCFEARLFVLRGSSMDIQAASTRFSAFVNRPSRSTHTSALTHAV